MGLIQSITALSSIKRNPGIFTIDAVAIPKDVRELTLKMARDKMSGMSGVIVWQVELSFDDGKTWVFAGGATAECGDIIDPDTGEVSPESSFTISCPQPNSLTRQVRGHVSYSAQTESNLVVDLKG